MSTHSADAVSKTTSHNLNRQISLYSLAAAVAGVSMLALAEPSAAEVVVTKKTIPIPLAPREMHEPVFISMANNGVENFSFILSSAASTSVGLRELLVVGMDQGQKGAQNQFIVGGDFYAKALALERGVKIGPAGIPSATFLSFGALVAGTNGGNGSYYSRGYWAGNLKNRYLGVRFQLNGQTHYGWIRLTVTTSVKSKKPSLQATITGYAYETVANKAIKAGTAATAAAAVQTPQHHAGPSLGMLAAGAESMPLWRREEGQAK